MLAKHETFNYSGSYFSPPFTFELMVNYLKSGDSLKERGTRLAYESSAWRFIAGS